MTLIPVDSDPRTATRTSRWDRRSRANSIVSTNVRQLQTLILIAVASLGAISGTLEGKLGVPIFSGILLGGVPGITMLYARLLVLLFAGVLVVSVETAVAFPLMSPGHDPASHNRLSFQVLDDPPSLDQPPVADGIVDRYLLNPRGDVNGLLLRDGSQIPVTLRAAQELIKTVQAGDHVRVHGRRVADLPLVKPDVIINVTDRTSFTVPYRLDLPMPPREVGPPVNEMKATGTIQVLLYDPSKGVVNGVLLSDGTQVRLPPDVGEHFQTSLQQNMDVEVEGYGTSTPYGRTLEAIAIGRKGQPLTHLDASTQQLR